MIILEEWIKSDRSDRQEHLRLNEPCIERGGNSTNHKGVLAEYLNTNIPYGNKILLCHACNNANCSNPRHIYWGTPKENVKDSIDCGTFYRGGRPKGYKQSEETKLKRSNSLKGKSRPKFAWDDNKLLQLKSQKLSNVKIGKMFGVSECSVRKRLKKLYSGIV